MESHVQPLQIDWLTIILNGGPIELSIMGLLVIMSLWAWMIILAKMRNLRVVYHLSEKFLIEFWEAKSLSEFNVTARDMKYSPAREVFRAGFNEMLRVLQVRDKRGIQNAVAFDTIKRALSRQKMIEESHLSSNLGILAICSSAGPYIGLFGTVVGIIRAFHDIGASGASSLAVVAPGVSESLIATALGLFVAIPAVIFYNVITSKIRKHSVLMDSFSADFMNILERHYTA